MRESSDRYDRKLDLAAHAAWLYYIGENTQEQIATKLNVSRQMAQRLVALAVSEKLIKFRLDHPLSECIALAEAIRDQFGLLVCEVVPSDGAIDTFNGIAVCAATHLEAYLVAKTPTILAFSTGRTLRSMVEQIPPMNQPQHKIVSILGNMSHAGRAGRHEVVIHLSDRVGSQAYPVPTPVVATNLKERDLLQTQHSFLTVKRLAEQAKATFVGVGQIVWNAPLHQDGFINDAEVTELIELGAVGEIAGWAYDRNGTLICGGTNSRVAGVPLEQPTQRLVIGVAGGAKKSESILAALHGKLISGLITDDSAAQAILASS
ncbi:sugar-binding transcriptional regulator [Phormidesmis sp. 146-20]